MEENKNRFSSLDSNLIQRLKKEKKPHINDIENALTYENNYLNAFLKNDKNNKKIGRNHSENNIDYIEAVKFIHKFNKNFEYNKNNYNQQRQESKNFKKSFEEMKKLQKKLPSLETEKINYNLSTLLGKYEKKGLKITKESLDKDLIKSNCGLLLTNDDLYKFYRYDSMINQNNKGKKSKKNLKFLFKIKRQANQMYNRKLVQQKKFEKVYEKVNLFKSSNNNKKNSISNTLPTQPGRKSLDIRNRRNSLNKFFKSKTINMNDKKEEKEGIKAINKLIVIEEKDNIIRKMKYDRENNENNICILFPKRKRIKKIKTINPIMPTHFERKSKNDNLYLISEENYINSSLDYLDNNNNIITNNINNQNNYQSESTNMTNSNKKEQKYKGLNSLTDIYRNLNLPNIMKKRLSSVHLINRLYSINKSGLMHSISENIKSNKRSSVEIPKSLKLSLKPSDIYEKISNLDFITYKKIKDKKRERVNMLLKKYYGKRYQDFNIKTNHIKIFNNFSRLKDELIRNEKKNEIYQKSEDLPELTKKKIELNLNNEEKLKSAGNIFIKHYYDKKLEE